MPTVKQNKQKKSKPKAVDRVTPVIKKPKAKDVDKISVTRSITSKMQGTPEWNAHPELQAQVKDWNVAADAIESTGKSAKATRATLTGLDAAQRTNRQNWSAASKQVAATVKVVSQGSADVVQTLGFDVVTRLAPGPVPAPTGLLAVPGTVTGEAGFTWQRGGVRRDFVVQHATDVANVATYSATVLCSKTKFTLEGLASGSIVHFRVAASDPRAASGMSPWSDWCGCTVG